MKKYIRRKAAAAFIALAFLIVFPMEALAEQGGTTFGIEQYGQDTDYTGWLDLTVRVLSPEGIPQSRIYIVVRKAGTTEEAGQGPQINGDKRYLTDDNGEIVFRVYPSPLSYEAYIPKQEKWKEQVHGPYQITDHTTVSITLERYTDGSSGGNGGSSSGSGGKPSQPEFPAQSEAQAEIPEVIYPEEPSGPEQGIGEGPSGTEEKSRPAGAIDAETGQMKDAGAKLPGKAPGAEEQEDGRDIDSILVQKDTQNAETAAQEAYSRLSKRVNVIIGGLAVLMTLLFLLRLRQIIAGTRDLSGQEGRKDGEI